MAQPVPDQWLLWPWKIECPSTKETSIACITICCVSLLIVLFISIIAIKNLITNTKINTSLKILFYISSIAAIAQLASSIATLSLCLQSSEDLQDYTLPLILFEFGYYILVLCILGTLLARLWTTFDDSIFRMGKTARVIFIMIYILIVFTCLGIITLFCITLVSLKSEEEQWDEYQDIYLWLVLMIWILYILAAMWAVYMFCRNILSLAELRRGSQIDVMQGNSPSNVKLNAFQLKMISLSSKYVALFTIAAVASLIVMIFWAYQGLEILSVPTICTLAGVDACINILCLYLQYSFAQKYYNKYCGLIEICCKIPLTKYMTKRISKAMKQNDEQEILVVNDT
eukprot:362793_1